MGDGDFGLRIQDHILGSDAAPPEHRYFAGLDVHAIAVVRFIYVHDADLRRVADVHRCTVHLFCPN